ncbi:hypothetical protein [Nannocystis pusilla]|uniref:hypothetical protein n=1 Tax=Nannocystis pusilla TaxID=889268 RepID=UPI003B7A47A1
MENALHELQCEAYDRDNNFTGIHKFLLKLVETSREDGVRRAALSAWGTVLDNRAKPEHIKALETLAGRDLPSYLMEEVVSVAAKFAEEGRCRWCSSWRGTRRPRCGRAWRRRCTSTPTTTCRAGAS